MANQIGQTQPHTLLDHELKRERAKLWLKTEDIISWWPSALKWTLKQACTAFSAFKSNLAIRPNLHALLHGHLQC